MIIQIVVYEIKVIRIRTPGQRCGSTRCVALTLCHVRIVQSPEPESGVKLFEKAETRSVLIGPDPGRTLPDTFRSLAVSPAPDTGGFWKATTVSSKVKSPWNPARLSASLISDVTTG